MKLRFGIISVLAVLFFACGGDEQSEEGNKNGIKVFGSIEGAENQKVRMWVFEPDGERLVDSTLVENGKFELWTDTKEMREYVIEFGSPTSLTKVNNWIYLFPDESASEIELTATFPNVGDSYTVKGDKNSEAFKKYLDFRQPHYQTIEQLNNEAINSADTGFVNQKLKEADSVKAILREYAVNYIDDDPASPVSWIMLTEFYPPSGLQNFDSLDLGYFEKVANAMREKYPYSEYPDYVDESIESTLAQMDQLKANPGGDAAPELAFNNPDGKEIKLSSLRGQVVLIDFWASWCGPCRQENPNVVATYNEYKDKGFTVYSVSLDTDKERWVQAIKDDNLIWPNHVSDLKGWESEAATLYNVRSIPATFLLDENGNIIDQNLRGGRLEQRLQEILG